MRLLRIILGSLAVLWAAHAQAAPPVQSWKEIDARRGPHTSARIRATLAAAREAGVDQGMRTRLSSAVNHRALVILLQFTDHPADTLNHTSAAYDSLLFSIGTQPTGSMRDYYREVSRGAMDISGVVTRWYTAPRPYSDYTSGTGGFGAPPLNAQQMALDAVSLADQDYDLTQFDGDGDGTVDGVFVVHAGPGGEETGNLGDIWSHQWNVPSAYHSTDGVNVFPYTTEPEEWAGNAVFTTPGALISIGVFCHEYGHVLGLPDLYDTSGLSSANEGIGEWDIMGSGIYNHVAGQPLASSPCHFSAWSLARLGWVTPTWVTKDSLGVAIPPVETSNQTFQLSTNGMEDAEYFLVENRQPIGFDAGLVRSSVESGEGPSHGLLIYHIDGGVIGQSDPNRKMIDVEEGGGVRIHSGFAGEQNLDLASGAVGTQATCGGTPNVVGNRGDKYDPWPGAGDRVDFDGFSCPNSLRNCGKIPTRVSVRGISETAGVVTADLLVTAPQIRRLQTVIDDTPIFGTPNNGNGVLESGEVVKLRFPIQNVGDDPSPPLLGLVESTSPYLTTAADTINYAALTPGQTDSGSVVYGEVNLAPDPGSAMVSFELRAPYSQVLGDSFQVFVGSHTGICENFEGTSAHWSSIALGCNGVNEWHREQGSNNTGFGSWAWRMGPTGPIGSYTQPQEARLVSPPILLPSASSTLRFFHRYDCEFAFDGLWVEISTDAGETWTPITPTGGYNTGDRYSGTKASFTEAVFPLTGYSGVVQFAWHFVAVPPNGGNGWWIDDISIDGGDAPCAPVEVAVDQFSAGLVEGSDPPRVRLQWSVTQGASGAVDLRRALSGFNPVSFVRIPDFTGAGAIEDANLLRGADYDYTLHFIRDGVPDLVAGPVRVSIPAPAPPAAPKVFSLSRIRPNPFNPDARLVVSLDRDGPFVVRIVRPDGTLVRTMRFATRPASTYEVRWDGRDDQGRAAASGLYLFELRFDSRTRVQKAVLLR